MKNFFDTRPFGAAFTALATLATGYAANASGWYLIILPVLIVPAYYLIFAAQDTERTPWRARPKRQAEIWLK